ncbi:MAG: hypothetical protein ACTSSH_06010 [Candidatus Heimdallarchaeota archaeon]
MTTNDLVVQKHIDYMSAGFNSPEMQRFERKSYKTKNGMRQWKELTVEDIVDLNLITSREVIIVDKVIHKTFFEKMEKFRQKFVSNQNINLIN